MRRVLLPFDFSQQARRALALVLNGIPFGVETQVDILHVVDDTMYSRILSTNAAPSEEDVRSYLANEIERVAPTKRKLISAPSLIVVRGRPVTEILERTKDYGAVVLGGQGHGGIGEALLGTTAMRLVREANISVYVAKKTNAVASLHRVICALDDDTGSRLALKEAVSLCRMSGAKLSLTRVVPIPLSNGSYPQFAVTPAPQDLEEENKRLIRFEVEVLKQRFADHQYIRFASAGFAKEIAHQAAIEDADVLVVGARENEIERQLLGSISESVVSRSVSDVYIVR